MSFWCSLCKSIDAFWWTPFFFFCGSAVNYSSGVGSLLSHVPGRGKLPRRMTAMRENLFVAWGYKQSELTLKGIYYHVKHASRSSDRKYVAQFISTVKYNDTPAALRARVGAGGLRLCSPYAIKGLCTCQQIRRNMGGLPCRSAIQ